MQHNYGHGHFGCCTPLHMTGSVSFVLVPVLRLQSSLRDFLLDGFGIHLSTHDHFFSLYIDVYGFDPCSPTPRLRSGHVSNFIFLSFLVYPSRVVARTFHFPKHPSDGSCTSLAAHGDAQHHFRHRRFRGSSRFCFCINGRSSCTGVRSPFDWRHLKGNLSFQSGGTPDRTVGSTRVERMSQGEGTMGARAVSLSFFSEKGGRWTTRPRQPHVRRRMWMVRSDPPCHNSVVATNWIYRTLLCVEIPRQFHPRSFLQPRATKCCEPSLALVLQCFLENLHGSDTSFQGFMVRERKDSIFIDP